MILRDKDTEKIRMGFNMAYCGPRRIGDVDDGMVRKQWPYAAVVICL